MTQTKKIKATFKERGLTQKAVARAMGKQPQNLSRALKADSVGDDWLKGIVKAVNTLSPYQKPVTERDLQTNEATITCPHCGEKITIKIE